jgi:hypothetical protein
MECTNGNKYQREKKKAWTVRALAVLVDIMRGIFLEREGVSLETFG